MLYSESTWGKGKEEYSSVSGDASDAGSLKIRLWWDVLRTRSPAYGYFSNATKSWLLVKKNVVQQARTLFEDSGINIIIEGRRLLGAAPASLGILAFVTIFIGESVTRLTTYVRTRRLQRLAEFAKSQPYMQHT